MSSSPLVSVIIPTYKHRDYISHTLDSVFAQSFRDFEVIVVNDGSPDDSDWVIRNHAAFGSIRYLQQPNAGQAGARNAGLAESRGEFIAFLDDDDLWPANKLEWQVDALASGDSVLIGGAVSLFQDGNPPHRHFAAKSAAIEYSDLANGCPFFSPGQTLIRASALRQIGCFDRSIWGADDFDLYIRLSRIGRLATSSRPSLFYRLHGANASLNRNRMLRNCATVVERHFGNAERTLRAHAYRSLYATVARDCALTTRRALRGGNFINAFRQLGFLRSFRAQLLSDPRLIRWILQDVLPGPWSSEDNSRQFHSVVEIPAPL
jgi:glycosyltransferase involved in cell wall biosynthesis